MFTKLQDIPSAKVPAAYLDSLANGPPPSLETLNGTSRLLEADRKSLAKVRMELIETRRHLEQTRAETMRDLVRRYRELQDREYSVSEKESAILTAGMSAGFESARSACLAMRSTKEGSGKGKRGRGSEDEGTGDWRPCVSRGLGDTNGGKSSSHFVATREMAELRNILHLKLAPFLRQLEADFPHLKSLKWISSREDMLACGWGGRQVHVLLKMSKDMFSYARFPPGA